MLELNFTSFPQNNGLFVCPTVITVRRHSPTTSSLRMCMKKLYFTDFMLAPAPKEGYLPPPPHFPMPLCHHQNVLISQVNQERWVPSNHHNCRCSPSDGASIMLSMRIITTRWPPCIKFPCNASASHNAMQCKFPKVQHSNTACSTDTSLDMYRRKMNK